MSKKIDKPLNAELLKKVFIHNLNRLYFGKCYLNEHLPHLLGLASFNALKMGLQEFADDVKNQITRMGEIYTLLNEKPSDKNCNAIKSIVKENFCLDDKNELAIITDMDIILYVQLLEHTNITVYRMLKIIALQLKMKQVTQLLTECFDEAIDDDHLFVLITKEYIDAG